jgi:hypothetical protein
VKFPRELETAWLLASALGFTLDVFVYHTFSLFIRSITKLLVGVRELPNLTRCSFVAPAGLPRDTAGTLCHAVHARSDHHCTSAARTIALS